MALTYPKLADIQYISNGIGTLFSNPASTKTYVKGMIIHNGNTTSEVVKLYNVPDSSGSAGSGGASNIFFNKSMAPGETLFIDCPGTGIVLSDTADTIQGITTTASKVTFQLNGIQDT